MIYQCQKCGLSKSDGAMGSVLPQCKCDWQQPTPQPAAPVIDESAAKRICTVLGWRPAHEWVEVEQVKWEGDKLIAKLREKNGGGA